MHFWNTEQNAKKIGHSKIPQSSPSQMKTNSVLTLLQAEWQKLSKLIYRGSLL